MTALVPVYYHSSLYNFLHPFNDEVSYIFIYRYFVSLFKIRPGYTIEVVLLSTIDPTKGGVMIHLIFVSFSIFFSFFICNGITSFTHRKSVFSLQ